MKFEIVVRELNNNKEARIELPDDRYIEKLTEKFGENWIEYDYEIVDVEDDYNIFNSYRLFGFQSLKELNKLANRIEEACATNHQIKTLQAASEVFTDIKEALEIIENNEMSLFEDHTSKDLAEWFVDEGWLGDINEKIISYIDYEKLGHDIILDGNYYETKYGVLEIR